MTANASAALELMRASALLDSDPAGAARRVSALLASSPDSPEANLLLAAACRRLGDLGSAIATLEPLAASQPHSSLILLELGRAYAAGGRGPEALATLERAVTLDAGLAEAWRELATQRFAAGDTLGGDRAYAHYVRLAPDPPALSDAQAALAENRLAAAAQMLQQHLRQKPDDVLALRRLAEIATRQGDTATAQRHLTECLRIAPGYAAARLDLARALYSQQRNTEVLALVERLLALEPDNSEYLNLKAQALRLVGRNAEALALLEGALAQHPDKHGIWVLYGHLLREVGEPQRAIAAYRQALSVRPGSGLAYWSLANLKTFRFEATDIAAMQAQEARTGVQDPERIHLQFALGKALEDEQQFADSFRHYALGNALQRARIPHDAEAMTADVQRVRQFYSAAFFAARAGWGSTRADPIFIVGLPRSGSTLLEQILASHSQVEGTRELSEFAAALQGLLQDAGTQAPATYPDAIAAWDRAQVEAFAARYLESTQRYRPLGRPRFVDKMLGNFAHVGLIHLAFPHAAIIDARRHPLGCGFSCYKQLFARGLNYSYDLRELGRWYVDYAAVMQHFDGVLPQRVHRVYYERLVTDAGPEVRRLLDYCGLPYEEQCLRFYETRRVVHTISSEQVRRPLYAESVDQWRHYEPWLGPLKEALGALVDSYPEASGTTGLQTRTATGARASS